MLEKRWRRDKLVVLGCLATSSQNLEADQGLNAYQISRFTEMSSGRVYRAIATLFKEDRIKYRKGILGANYWSLQNER